MYNYARFNSIFDFGANYNVNDINSLALNSLNPIGLFIRWFVDFMSFLFIPNNYSLEFPYIQYVRPGFYNHKMGVLVIADGCPGMINFPIVFCLFYLFKKYCRQIHNTCPKAFNIVRTFLIVAAFNTAVCSLKFGYFARYRLDFAAFIIIPSLFCAYFWSVCPKSELSVKTRYKVIYVLLAATIFVGLCLFASGTEGSKLPIMYRYLEYSLGFIRNV